MSDGAKPIRDLIDHYLTDHSELSPEIPGTKFARCDHFLAWLWEKGFMVVAIKERDHAG